MKIPKLSLVSSSAHRGRGRVREFRGHGISLLTSGAVQASFWGMARLARVVAPQFIGKLARLLGRPLPRPKPGPS